jgi:hypothetical protein
MLAETVAELSESNAVAEDMIRVEQLNKRPRYDRNSNTAFGPTYVHATDEWQARLDAASLYEPSYKTEEGERFSDTLSEVIESNAAVKGQTIMIPADKKNKDELLDADWGATSNFVSATREE